MENLEFALCCNQIRTKMFAIILNLPLSNKYHEIGVICYFNELQQHCWFICNIDDLYDSHEVKMSWYSQTSL